jgi:hypothetical protein
MSTSEVPAVQPVAARAIVLRANVSTADLGSDSAWFSQRIAEGYPGGLERNLERAQELVEQYYRELSEGRRERR